jgi:RNA polymerase sigma-70 factor (ECF subfamily)
MLKRLGVSPADLDDAVQQVFLIALDKIHPQPGPSDGGFLLAIALRVASDRRKAQRRRREVALEPGDDRLPTHDSPEAHLERQRALQLADRLLEELPWDQRVVFVLYEVEERSMAEIAEVLGIPQGTVASRLRKAREDFQKAVARQRARTRARGERD